MPSSKMFASLEGSSGSAWRPIVLTSIAAVLLLGSWLCLGCAVLPAWLAFAFVSAAALLAAGIYASEVRFIPGRLTTFGKGRVLVRSLDDWTMYHYNVPFDGASAEQQSHALDHYKVGDRLFPARPKDASPKRTYLQAAAMFVTFCSFITLSEALRGWHRLYLFLAFYAWLGLCTWWSKRLSGAAKSSLVEIGSI